MSWTALLALWAASSAAAARPSAPCSPPAGCVRACRSGSLIACLPAPAFRWRSWQPRPLLQPP
jgi:hypothetical protein